MIVSAIALFLQGCSNNDSGTKNLSQYSTELSDKMSARRSILFLSWTNNGVDDVASLVQSQEIARLVVTEAEEACIDGKDSPKCLEYKAQKISECKRAALVGSSIEKIGCRALMKQHLMAEGIIRQPPTEHEVVLSQVAEEVDQSQLQFFSDIENKLPNDNESSSGVGYQGSGEYFKFEPLGFLGHFTQIEKDLVNKAVSFLQEAYKLPAFYEGIENLEPFQEPLTCTNVRSHHAPGDIVTGAKIAEYLSHQKVAVSFKYMAKNTTTTGKSGFGSRHIILNVNHDQFRRSSGSYGGYPLHIAIAGTIFHESMHILGFSHCGNKPRFRSYTAKQKKALHFQGRDFVRSLPDESNTYALVDNNSQNEPSDELFVNLLANAYNDNLAKLVNLDENDDLGQEFGDDDQSDGISNEESIIEKSQSIPACHSEIGIFLTPDILLYKTIHSDICNGNRARIYAESHAGNAIYGNYAYENMDDGGLGFEDVATGDFKPDSAVGWSLMRIHYKSIEPSNDYKSSQFSPIMILPVSHGDTYYLDYSVDTSNDVIIENGNPTKIAIAPEIGVHNEGFTSRLIDGTGISKGMIYSDISESQSAVVGIGFNLSDQDTSLQVYADYALATIIETLESRGKGDVANEIAQAQCSLWKENEIPAVCLIGKISDQYCPGTLKQPTEVQDIQYKCNLVNPKEVSEKYIEETQDVRLQTAGTTGGCTIKHRKASLVHSNLLSLFAFSIFLLASRKLSITMGMIVALLALSCGEQSDSGASNVNNSTEIPQVEQGSVTIEAESKEFLTGSWSSECDLLLGVNNDRKAIFRTIEIFFNTQNSSSGSFDWKETIHADDKCIKPLMIQDFVGNYSLSSNHTEQKQKISLTVTSVVFELFDDTLFSAFNYNDTCDGRLIENSKIDVTNICRDAYPGEFYVFNVLVDESSLFFEEHYEHGVSLTLSKQRTAN